MTTLVLGTAGAIAGNAILPGIGGQLGFLVGSLLGNLIDPPKIEGPRRSDLKLQRSEYGQMLPFVWGTGRISGNVLDQTDLVEHKQTSGGKGGPEVTNYTYSASFLIALAATKRFNTDAIKGVVRIWADGRLIWAEIDGTEMPCTLYLGGEDQEPDPTFEAINGVGQQPAYRGLAYVVFADFMLTDFGDRIPLLEFEVYTHEGEYPWRVSTFEPWPTANSLFGTNLNSGAYRDESGVITTHTYTTVAAHLYQAQFLIDGTTITAETDTAMAFANTGEGFRRTVVGNRAAAVFNSWNHLPGSGYGWYSGASPGAEITGGIPKAVLSIYQSSSVYSIADIGGDYYFARYSAFSGLQDATYGPITFAVGDFSNIRLGTSDDGNVWAIDPQNERMWKFDGSLNLLHAWTSGTWSALFDDQSYNFHVYKDQICFDNGKPVRKLWVVQVNEDYTFTYVGETDMQAGEVISLGGCLVLVADGVISLCPPPATLRLSEIVDDLSSMTSLATRGSPQSDAYNTAELTDEVRWYAVGTQTTVRNAIDPLRKGFFFDAVESDDMVVFKKRGATDSVVTLDDDDLDAREYGTEPGTALTTTRKREQGMPRNVTLRYIDVDMDYQTGAQHSPRLTTLSDSDVTLDLPIGFNANEALQKCWSIQVSEWIERESFTWSTTRKYAWVEPCDVVTGRGRVVRVTNKSESPAGVITWEGVLHRPSIYTQEQTAGSSSGFEEQTGSASAVPTQVLLLDIPILSQAHSPFGFYAAMGPSIDGYWPGATLYKSVDGGLNYFAVASSATASVIGVTASSDTYGSPVGSPTIGGALSDYYGGDVVDESSICVRLTDDDAELSSITSLGLANGMNLCAISRGTAGSPVDTEWELLQFRDAELIADKTYILTGFLRGRKETLTTNHSSGDWFVVLPVTNVDAPESELNVELLYKAVTFGKTLADTTEFYFTNTGKATDEFYDTEIGHLPVYGTNPGGSPAELGPGVVPPPHGNSCDSTYFLNECGQWAIPGGGTGSPSAGGSVAIYDEGVLVDSAVSALNFVGAAVGVIDQGATTDINIHAIPDDAPVLLAASMGSPNLTNGRILAAGSNITLTDNGPGGTLDIICTLSNGGRSQSTEYMTPGAATFTVPDEVGIVYVTMIGGGGGGSSRNAAASGGGGGGAGESVVRMPVAVTASSGSPSNTIAITVGSAGVGATGAGSNVVGGDGGTSSFGSWNAIGGRGGATTGVGGAGGGPGGGTGGAVGNPGSVGSLGSGESAVHFGGSGGSGGGSTTASNGGAGRAAPGYSTGTAGGVAGGSQAGGGSGAGSLFGQGGSGGAGGSAGSAPTSTNYGAGGGGAGGKATTGVNGGDGAGGYVLVEWVA